MVLLFLIGGGGAIAQILSNIFSLNLLHYSNWVLAIVIICFNPITFYVVMNYFHWIMTVSICECGISYFQKAPITWKNMAACGISFIDGLPYLTFLECPSKRTFEVPLYVEDIKLFVKTLNDIIPGDHAIKKLVPEMESMSFDELPSKIHWWQF